MPERTVIVIHAGMGKTGSTAIQRWLGRHTDLLAGHGFTLVVARPVDGPALVQVDPYESGPASSGRVARLLRLGELGPEAVQRFADGLHRQAEASGGVVISAEALSQLFFMRDRAFLVALNDLARQHEVRVAYYVRPQHTALEAGWRQWGFRTPLGPSKYVQGYARHLHYAQTLHQVTHDAPEIDFRLRPFRRDLLDGADVVRDFAAQMLGIEAGVVETEPDSNVGFPLAVVNLLAAVPEGVLWDSPHDNRRLGRLKRVLDGGGGPEAARLPELLWTLSEGGDRTERGRRVLQRWAHRRYADDNRALIDLGGWDAADWLPDVAAETDEVTALDELWSWSASPSELAALRRALEQAGLDVLPRRPPAPRSRAPAPRTPAQDDEAQP